MDAHLRIHTLQEFPREAVGCLLGVWDQGALRLLHALPVENGHPFPENHFEVSPESVLWAENEAQRQGLALLGWYHSHPNGKPEPSEEDRRGAVPFWIFGIVSVRGEQTEVRFYGFFQESQRFEELEWAIS